MEHDSKHTAQENIQKVIRSNVNMFLSEESGTHCDASHVARVQQELNLLTTSTEYYVGRAIVGLFRRPWKNLPLFIRSSFRGAKRAWRIIHRRFIRITKPPSLAHPHVLKLHKPDSQFSDFTDWPYLLKFEGELCEHEDILNTGWSARWSAVGGARLGEGGCVTSIGSERYIGAMRTGCLVFPGQFYRLSLLVPQELNHAILNVAIVPSGSFDKTRPLTQSLAPMISASAVSSRRRLFFDFFVPIEVDSVDVLLLTESPVSTRAFVLAEFEMFRHLSVLRYELSQGQRVIASIASIPSREEQLHNTVLSLLPQVDEVRVFLNGYKYIPQFLLGNPAITTACSQEWGNRGDAGKFFWAGDSLDGYRFTCDDDIIYPYDYVYRTIEKLRFYSDVAIIGVHGIILKQPIYDYYADNYRYVYAFHRRSLADIGCQVLGTGTIAYNTKVIPKLSIADFFFPNMADIWLAKIGQELGVPFVAQKRPSNWLVPQRPTVATGTIYWNSVKSRCDFMDTSSLQTLAIQGTVPLTVHVPEHHRGPIYRVFLCIMVSGKSQYLRSCVKSFVMTADSRFNWIIAFIETCEDPDSMSFLESLVLPFEMHMVSAEPQHRHHAINEVFRLAQSLHFDFGFILWDIIQFKSPGWDRLYVEAVLHSGYDHLLFREQRLDSKKEALLKHPRMARDESGWCESQCSKLQGLDLLFTFTPRMLTTLDGMNTELDFSLALEDFKARACALGFNNDDTIFDARDSHDLIESSVSSNRLEELINSHYVSAKYVASAKHLVNKLPTMTSKARNCETSVSGTVDALFICAHSDREELDIGPFRRFAGHVSLISQVPTDYTGPEGLRHAELTGLWQLNRREAVKSALEKALEQQYQCVVCVTEVAGAQLLQINQDHLMACLRQLPDNWLIWQLDRKFFHGADSAAENTSEICECSILDSSALAFHRRALPMVLGAITCFEASNSLSSEILLKICERYPRQCVATIPPLL